ncbi:MAG: SDR family oxidoreductase, partial [Planctomycetota bacterium]
MRTIVITGAYGRLGRCFATAFIAAGDQVILTGRNAERLHSATSELGAADCYQLDHADGKQVAAFAGWLGEHYPQVDVLINNAARMGGGGSLAQVDAGVFADMVHSNICGPFQVTQALLPALQRSSAPLVINVSSTSGHRADAESAAYNASKFGLMGLSEALRKDLRRQGIRVTTLSPSSINYAPDAALDGKGARLHGDDIAAAALWLASAPPRTVVRDIEMWA